MVAILISVCDLALTPKSLEMRLNGTSAYLTELLALDIYEPQVSMAGIPAVNLSRISEAREEK